MRLIPAVLILAVLSCGAQILSRSYWLMLMDDGRTWCGYSEEAEFKSEADKLKPTETARITYSPDRLLELTYQVEPESGDWIVIDKYTPSGDEILLRRASLLTQSNLQVIQDTTIRQGKAEPFRIVNITTLDGKKAETSDIDFPSVPVRTNLSSTPFVALAAEMRSRSLATLCKK